MAAASAFQYYIYGSYTHTQLQIQFGKYQGLMQTYI